MTTIYILSDELFPQFIHHWLIHCHDMKKLSALLLSSNFCHSFCLDRKSFSSHFITMKLVLSHGAIAAALLQVSGAGERWSEQKANLWYLENGWMSGCNFNPSSSINQLEFWQADTFDPITIDRELGWAAELGFNSMRVYLHNLVWETDKKGFKKRIDTFLAACRS